VVEFLILTKADPNVKDKHGCTPLHMVAHEIQTGRKGLLDVAKALAEAKADVEAQDGAGRAPVHTASTEHGPEVVPLIRCLVDHGATVNLVDYAGDTPLHLASRANGTAALVTCLVQAKADMNARDCELRTPLHLALLNDEPFIASSVALSLIEEGVSVNIEDGHGQTPLHLVAESEEIPLEMLNILLNHGAQVHARDLQGHTPISIAMDQQHDAPGDERAQEAVEILLDAQDAQQDACGLEGAFSSERMGSIEELMMDKLENDVIRVTHEHAREQKQGLFW